MKDLLGGFDPRDIERLEILGRRVGTGPNAELVAADIAVYRVGQDEPDIYPYEFEEPGMPAAQLDDTIRLVNLALNQRRGGGPA